MVIKHTMQLSKDEVKCALCSRIFSASSAHEIEAVLPMSIIHGDVKYAPTKMQICEHCYNNLREKMSEKLIVSSRVGKSEKS